MKRKKGDPVLPLGPVLESAVVGALISGKLSLKSVQRMELSKPGQAIYKILHDNDGKPLGLKTIKVACTEVHGIDKVELKEYLDGLLMDSDIASTLQTLRRKRVVNNLVNEATTQIASGDYSLMPLRAILDSHKADIKPLTPLADETEEPAPPKGLAIRSLPRLTEKSGGLFGVWLIGGGPGVGKSTLTLQIALSIAKRYKPVLHYDFELGRGVVRYHIHQALGEDQRAIKEATKQYYLRTSIGTLEADLEFIGKPCVVVVDSFQKIESSVTYRRESLDTWVHRLEALKRKDHDVILVSEKSRGNYKEPNLQGYKETGELEYAADLALDLVLPDEQDAGRVDVHITKNRHYKKKGLVCQLERVNSWWFKQVGHGGV